MTTKQMKPKENGQVKELPSLEDLNKMKEELLTKKANQCLAEVNAIMEKYNMKFSVTLIVSNEKIERSEVVILPK